MRRRRRVFWIILLAGCAPRSVLDGSVDDDARAQDALTGPLRPLADGGADPSIEGDASAREDTTDATRAGEADVSTDAVQPAEGGADGGRSLRVLFVGNSYTYVNDLPAILARMAARARPPVALTVASVTLGGATLRTHWESSGAQGRLRAEPWDAVVLQGQSVEPLWQPEVFAAHADRFGALARERDVRPLWFATWARRADSDVYAERWSGGSVDAMTAALEGGYASARGRNGGALARVGEAWRRSLAMRPSLALHDGDGSHPTVAGSYLAACVLYLALVGEPLPDAPDAVTGLTMEDTAALRSTALGVGTAP